MDKEQLIILAGMGALAYLLYRQYQPGRVEPVTGGGGGGSGVPGYKPRPTPTAEQIQAARARTASVFRNLGSRPPTGPPV